MLNLPRLPRTAYPSAFPDKPGGTAADYGRYLTVKVAPKSVWSPLKRTFTAPSRTSMVTSMEPRSSPGSRKLIGEQPLDFKLKNGGLQTGGYSVYVTGKARQPKQCGNSRQEHKPPASSGAPGRARRAAPARRGLGDQSPVPACGRRR